MNNAFTVYGNKTGVNPNLATREALMLLPGMSGDTIETIMTKRREEEFKSYSDHFFTIAVQVKEAEEIDKLASTTDESQNTDEKRDENSFSDSTTIQSASTEKQYAYMLTVKPKGVNKLPIRLMVYPYGVLPDTQHEQFLSDDDDDKKGSYNNQSKPFQNKSSSQFTSMPF